MAQTHGAILLCVDILTTSHHNFMAAADSAVVLMELVVQWD